MIISNDTKKPLIKFKALIIKALRKSEINWNILNLIKRNGKKNTHTQKLTSHFIVKYQTLSP